MTYTLSRNTESATKSYFYNFLIRKIEITFMYELNSTLTKGTAINMVSTSNPSYIKTGPFAFDEVFNQDALRDIYEFWLRDNGVKYAKETMAAWSMRLKEHGFYYNIYIRKREPGMCFVPPDVIQFGMPHDAVANRDRTTISLANVWDELFQAINDKQQPLPYPPTALAHINYMLANYREDADHTAISYVLPTFNELYSVQQTTENTIVTTEPAGNGQYRTHTMYGDEEYDHCKIRKCEICRWMTEDEPMDGDEDITGDELSEIEPADITERDVDAAKLSLDINNCRWGIISENDQKNTALVMREFSLCFKKGETVQTGDLYHRPLYYSDMYSGYWINRDSDLYRLIKQNNHPNPAVTWMACYKPRDEPETTTPSKTTPREISAGEKLRNDLKNWYIVGTMKYRNSALICPNDGSVFAMMNRHGCMVYDTVIDTGDLYHRPLYYSDKYSGYWINTKSEIARIIGL